MSAKDRTGQFLFLPGGPVHPIFPVADRGGIDAEFMSQLLLRQASGPAGRTEAFGEGASRRRRIVAQKSNDGGNVLNGGVGCVAFPEGDGLRVDPDLLGNLLLEKPEVDPAGADMVT